MLIGYEWFESIFIISIASGEVDGFCLRGFWFNMYYVIKKEEGLKNADF